MSTGAPEERHPEDSHHVGDEDMENKIDKEASNQKTSQQMAQGTPEEHYSHREDSDSPSVVANGADDDNEDNDDCGNASSSSESSMAKGLSVFISSIMEDYDSRAEATVSSQNQLSFALDRLTGELDQLLEEAPLPFIMQHAARISGVRKRVKSLNLVLKSIQRRMDSIDRILSTGSMQGNPGPNS